MDSVRRDRKGRAKASCPLRRAGQGWAGQAPEGQDGGNLAEQGTVKMEARRAGGVVSSKSSGLWPQNEPGAESFQN